MECKRAKRRLIDFAGRKFGLLTAIEPDPTSESRAIKWIVRCDCGTVKSVHRCALRDGSTKSCGCNKQAARLPKITKHSYTWREGNKGRCLPEYRAWIGAKTRCYDPSHDAYPRYGGRGIVVCDRWLNSFESFLADMGPKPSESHSLDRIDYDGNYEPSNCRWATPVQQAGNKASNIMVEIGGIRVCASEADRILGTPNGTTSGRVKAGWPEWLIAIAPAGYSWRSFKLYPFDVIKLQQLASVRRGVISRAYVPTN